MPKEIRGENAGSAAARTIETKETGDGGKSVEDIAAFTAEAEKLKLDINSDKVARTAGSEQIKTEYFSPKTKENDSEGETAEIKTEEIYLTRGGKFEGTANGYCTAKIIVRPDSNGDKFAYPDEASAKRQTGGIKLSYISMGEGSHTALSETEYMKLTGKDEAVGRGGKPKKIKKGLLGAMQALLKM